MSKLTAILIATAIAALLVAAAASAGLPRPKRSNEIDVVRSIGGVELGMRLKRADREWGRTGDCGRIRERKGIRACAYESRNPGAGSAAIEAARRSAVSSVGIYAGLDGKRYTFKGRLRRLRTEDGIRLGSPRADVRKAYPTALRAANKTGFLVEGPGRTYMSFQTLDRKRVTGITLVDGTSQGRTAALESLFAKRP
jgi:hypothetical protein